MTDDQDIAPATVRRTLLERLAELDRLATASRGDRQPVALDQSAVGRLSRMDALQGQAMALETERRRALERQRIEAALARLDAGEYGDCVRCGEPIAPRRLAMDPTTPLCVACARGG